MLKSLMVGVSETRFSQAAVDYSLLLAQQYRASLIGLGIVDTPHLVRAEPVPLGGGIFKRERDELVLGEARDKTRAMLGEFQKRCAALGLDGRTMQVEGEPAEVLVQESQRVDLLVVGKKHLAEKEWESTSGTLRAILHQSARPVVCVPAEPAGGKPVLLAYDGSLQSAKALQLFVASGLAIDREIHLLTATADGPALSQRAAEFLHAHNLQVHRHLEGEAHASRLILDTADRLQAGMIVMGAYGQPRIREFIFGSVTKTVLQETKIPLFLYH